ncbi:hypothetical protein VPHK71_0068 [Vibrio phage K71]
MIRDITKPYRNKKNRALHKERGHFLLHYW